MIKLLMPLISTAMLVIALSAHSQETVKDEKTIVVGNSAVEVEVLQKSQSAPTDDSLWEETKSNLSVKSLGRYLAAYPNGKYSSDARLKSEELKEKARTKTKQDKALDAYRKRRIAGGLVLELDSKLTDVRPYVRSMLNSCGYNVAEAHRFAKRVYPTLVIDGRVVNTKSDAEHVVKLDLSLVLKTKTREIKARDKMSSYRISNVDSHQAVLAAFEDVGAQMKSGGFCIVN